MILRQLDLTTALRPSLLPEEILLFVQDGVGLYRDKFKIEGYQNGHAYLTSHRICYIDNDEPRQRSVAVDLKDVDRPEFYAGFLKSSPKITIYPKAPKRQSLAIRAPVSPYRSTAHSSVSSSPTRPGFAPASPSPAAAQPETKATWVCPICSFSNPVPSNFDPSTANANTPLPPCLACGIKPPLVHVTKAAIAAIANRPATSVISDATTSMSRSASVNAARGAIISDSQGNAGVSAKYIECPRCTFRNHPSLTSCEICGATLTSPRDNRLDMLSRTPPRSESPAPTTSLTLPPALDEALEVIKLSFRTGGEKVFFDRLKDALIQRKWLLRSAPPPPRPSRSPPKLDPGSPSAPFPQEEPPQRRIGIAGLERRDRDMRKENEIVMGSAFEDLEALMTSAKEVIAMAERFARTTSNTGNPQADATAAAAAAASSQLLSESATALGLTATRDMLLPGSSAERTYLTQLARDLAEYLTDDARGVLRREGGVMTLVDLWAVFNRRRNGIELISPHDFAAAARLWEELRLPVRLRAFRSGTLVVQGKDRTDERTIASLLDWLRSLRLAGPTPGPSSPPANFTPEEPEQGAPDPESSSSGINDVGYDFALFGRGVTAQEAAERFGWSVGVAAEELDVAEERGALVRDQDASGVRFWVNSLADVPLDLTKDDDTG